MTQVLQSPAWRRGGVFALAFSLRLAHTVLIQDTPFFDSPIVDAQTYDEQAQAIAQALPQGHLGLEGAFWQPPLYPILLGIFYTLVGRELLWVRIVQAMLGALTCTLAAELSARRAGPHAGWATGILMALYAPLIFFDAELLVPVLSLFLDTLALLLLWPVLGQALPQGSRPTPQDGSTWASSLKRLGLSGLVLGLSAGARPTILLFALWVGVVLWRKGRAAALEEPPAARASRTRLSVWPVAVFALSLSLPILPITGWNAWVAHEPALISTNGGINFYLGNHPHMLEKLAIRPGLGWKALMQEPLATGVRGDAAISRWWTERALEEALHAPGAVLKGWLIKLGFLVEAFERYRNLDMLFFADQLAPHLRWGLGYGLLLPLACLGRLGRSRRHPSTLLDGFLLAQVVGLLLFFVVTRYRLSLVPALAIYAGAGAAEALQYGKRLWLGVSPFSTPEERSLAWPGLAAALLLIPLMRLDPTGTQTVDLAEGFNLMGQAHSNVGRRKEAVAAFQRALELNPQHLDAVFNLGREYQLLGSCQQAMPLYLKTLDAFPQDRDVLSNTGVCALALGQVAQGLSWLETTARLFPGSPEVHFNLAQALAEERRYREALERLARAQALRPGEPVLEQARQDWLRAEALEQQLREVFQKAVARKETAPRVSSVPAEAIRLNNAGHAHLRARALEDALEALVRCVALAPGYEIGWLNLGQTLYALGRMEEAERAFRRALDLNPEYERARQGLALSVGRIPGREQEAEALRRESRHTVP